MYIWGNKNIYVKPLRIIESLCWIAAASYNTQPPHFDSFSFSKVGKRFNTRTARLTVGKPVWRSNPLTIHTARGREHRCMSKTAFSLQCIWNPHGRPAPNSTYIFLIKTSFEHKPAIKPGSWHSFEANSESFWFLCVWDRKTERVLLSELQGPHEKKPSHAPALWSDILKPPGYQFQQIETVEAEYLRGFLWLYLVWVEDKDLHQDCEIAHQL